MVYNSLLDGPMGYPGPGPVKAKKRRKKGGLVQKGSVADLIVTAGRKADRRKKLLDSARRKGKGKLTKAERKVLREENAKKARARKIKGKVKYVVKGTAKGSKIIGKAAYKGAKAGSKAVAKGFSKLREAVRAAREKKKQAQKQAAVKKAFKEKGIEVIE